MNRYSFINFINRFFGRDDAEASKNLAKERLRLVLVHDRLDISEHTMNSLRVDLINVIGKYFGIDEKSLEVSLSREADGIALLANMPILGPKREEMPSEADKPAASDKSTSKKAKPDASSAEQVAQDQPTLFEADKEASQSKQIESKKNSNTKKSLPQRNSPKQA